ncbi:hypothetical protein DRO91_02980 [Candidatus Heimdallarchaeota archaeon]|nr:MAG: hypothetical protein DRP02_04990 [Candidatus Gerdarchaeota archaeon]RLI73440.1 MAG: hypothetical protein DRO91_02980 [Candidatus Heimdallarchaeota archaeon]
MFQITAALNLSKRVHNWAPTLHKFMQKGSRASWRFQESTAYEWFAGLKYELKTGFTPQTIRKK